MKALQNSENFQTTSQKDWLSQALLEEKYAVRIKLQNMVLDIENFRSSDITYIANAKKLLRLAQELVL